MTLLSRMNENTRFTGGLDDILGLLIMEFPASHKAYFVVDGLDECDGAERDILIEAFQKIQKLLKVLLCLSFRIEPNNSLSSITERLEATRIVSIPDDNPDIEAFIEANLEHCLRHKRLIIGDPTLILSIQDALLKGSQGMFLWVALQIQSLCSMKTDQAIRQALVDLPKDLSETFSRILHKSGNSDRSLQAKTLQIVLAAYRPLTTDGLREALSVIPGDATWDASKLLNDVHSALACCGCLLIVDEEDSTVQVVHYSVKQYIFKSLNGAYAIFSSGEAQRMMADIIVTYMGYGVFGSELSRAKVRPVLAQSTPSRVMHATMGSSTTALDITMRLLKSKRQPKMGISKTLAEARSISKSKVINEYWFYSNAKTYWSNHVLYVSGQDTTILKLSIKLIKMQNLEISMASKDCVSHCQYAAENGNENIVKLLIESGKIDADVKDKDGWTPLMWAARNGYRDTVELLLSTGKVDVDAKNKGSTPLMLAARYGHGNIVRLLLPNTGDIDAEDEEGWTPLMLSVQNGDKDTVELLLNTRRVDVNTKNKHGLTALMLAAQNGHDDVVELLLTPGTTDVNVRDNNGWTALMRAAEDGRKGVVELLLNASNIKVDNDQGWTLLICAAKEGHKEIIELLLDSGKVDINGKGSDGTTPLMWAVLNGEKGIVGQLLRSRYVDFDPASNVGWSFITYAAQNGHKDVVEVLLESGKVDINAKNGVGLTPLMWAALTGERDIVDLLLSSRFVNFEPNSKDVWTLLMCPAQSGHRDIVELLLDSGKVYIDAKNDDGLALLASAVESGHRDIVKMLLDSGRVDLDAKNGDGLTLLASAAQKGYKDIVELLLATKKVDLTIKSINEWTPLMWAAQNGHKDIVKLLVKARGTQIV